MNRLACAQQVAAQNALQPDQSVILQLVEEHGARDWFEIRRHLYELHSETRASETARQLRALVAMGRLCRLDTGAYATRPAGG